MSAFVCSTTTIAVVARRLVQRFQGADEGMHVSDFAENILMLNLKSVSSRYSLTKAKACKEFTGKSTTEYTREVRQVADTALTWKREVPDARLWGAVSCLIYQCCEFSGVEKDITYKTLLQFEAVLEASCTRKGIKREGWEM